MQTRQAGATHIVAIMSGNFVQRGEPACFDKWVRTKTALSAGVDLVIELPLPWVVAGAETFAAGGVSIVNALGCVHQLSFGSECGDIEALSAVADILRTEQFSQALQVELQKESLLRLHARRLCCLLQIRRPLLYWNIQIIFLPLLIVTH